MRKEQKNASPDEEVLAASSEMKLKQVLVYQFLSLRLGIRGPSTHWIMKNGALVSLRMVP